MPEELKQAAQAALDQLEFLNACYPHKTATDAADALRRALTQRPAAQTEREAFEGWARPNGYDLRRNDVLGHYSSIDTSRAWSGFRAGRASLPAPQQATPEQPSGFEGRVIVGHSKHRGGWFVYEECSPGEYDPIKGPFPSRESADAAMRDPNAPLIQQATPAAEPADEHRSFMQQFDDARANIAAISQALESSTPKQATPDLADGPARMHWTNWMPVKDALEYAYQKMGLEMVKTDAGAKYPNLHWNLAGLVREFVVAQQDAMFGKCQACGKSMGLLDQIKCLDCGTRLCEPCAKEHFGSGHGKRAAEAHGSIEPTTSGWVETSAPPQRLDWSGTQQATPEPVGEVVAYREKLTGRLCEPEDTHRRKFPMCYEPLTRPAPGVPEGFALVPMTEDQVWHNDSIMSANGICGLKMHAVMRIVRGVEAHHSERLAAAQAKGGCDGA